MSIPEIYKIFISSTGISVDSRTIIKKYEDFADNVKNISKKPPPPSKQKHFPKGALSPLTNSI